MLKWKKNKKPPFFWETPTIGATLSTQKSSAATLSTQNLRALFALFLHFWPCKRMLTAHKTHKRGPIDSWLVPMSQRQKTAPSLGSISTIVVKSPEKIEALRLKTLWSKWTKKADLACPVLGSNPFHVDCEGPFVHWRL